MKCSNCGVETDGDARCCKSCGFELDSLNNNNKVEDNQRTNSNQEDQQKEASFLEKLVADLVGFVGIAVIVIVVLALLGVFN